VTLAHFEASHSIGHRIQLETGKRSLTFDAS
jgi:hypothetical protein